MLFNATQPEELRVALVDGQKLYDLDIEAAGREQKKANIYKALITRIEPSLEAAFVDYGAQRHGFLPLKEISRTYFNPAVDLSNGRVNIKDVLKEGQELTVQVEKEERGNKGAALTTFVSLAGRYLVLMPNNPRAGGVSRRIVGDDRNEIRDAMANLSVPDDMGLIVRTAGVGKNAEDLQWDLDYLVQLWKAVEKATQDRSAPFLVYQESNVIIRAIRDYLRNDISEILIDNKATYEKAKEFMQLVMPHNLNKIKYYDDNVPLFTRYQIESQIETAFRREVTLPSGGAIVIDHTEALLSIDINSAKATKGGDIEETALNTNREAAEEVARQLRLRDLGGLIVIDFIDMASPRNQRDVENTLKEALKMDRARVQVGRISRFGLLEMSRQRLKPSLGESSQIVCPRCEGQGTVRGIESLALSVLRIIEEDAMKEHTSKIIVQLPVDVATFLLNEKRSAVTEIENRQGVTVILVPNSQFETPHYDIHRIRENDVANASDKQSSYELATQKEGKSESISEPTPESLEEPAVKGIVPQQPVPKQAVQGGSILSRIWSFFSGLSEPKQAQKPTPSKTPSRSTQKPRNTRGGQGRSSSQKPSQRRRPQQRRQGQKTERKDNTRHPEQNKTPKDTRATQQKHSSTEDNKNRQPNRSSRGDQSNNTHAPSVVAESKTNTDTQRDGQQPSPTSAPHQDQSQGQKSKSSSGNTRRTRRGGRRRRRDNENSDAANTTANQNNFNPPSDTQKNDGDTAQPNTSNATANDRQTATGNTTTGQENIGNSREQNSNREHDANKPNRTENDSTNNPVSSNPTSPNATGSNTDTFTNNRAQSTSVVVGANETKRRQDPEQSTRHETSQKNPDHEREQAQDTHTDGSVTSSKSNAASQSSRKDQEVTSPFLPDQKKPANETRPPVTATKPQTDSSENHSNNLSNGHSSDKPKKNPDSAEKRSFSSDIEAKPVNPKLFENAPNTTDSRTNETKSAPITKHSHKDAQKPEASEQNRSTAREDTFRHRNHSNNVDSAVVSTPYTPSSNPTAAVASVSPLTDKRSDNNDGHGNTKEPALDNANNNKSSSS